MATTNITDKELLDELKRRLSSDLHDSRQEEVRRMEREIQSLSKRIQESESGKSQFLSNVRNEINNPLTSIIGLASTIHGMTTESRIKRMSKLIHQQAKDLDFQMRNVITAAEIEMGELKLCASRVNVMTLLENVVSCFQDKSSERGVTLQLRTPEHLKFITDAHVLETICLNLVSNAVAYTRANTVVVIEAHADDGCLNISVRDLGDGIEDLVRQNLFQRFRQGTGGLRKMHGGHGLGLCIVKELVTHLDGGMGLQSSPKEGTNVSIRIPELHATAETNTSSIGNELLFTVDAQF